MEKIFLGIEIGGTKLQIGLGDSSAKILRRKRFFVNPKKGGAGIRLQIENELKKLRAENILSAIGVGFGGPVDWKTGKICCSHQIEGWSDFELGNWLRAKTGLPVAIDNDANVAALGEAIHGAGIGFNPVFYVTLGSGVGGGLVADGKIYRGAKPGESEIGHLRLDRDGTTLESRCSGWAVDKKFREAKIKNSKSALAKLNLYVQTGEAKFLKAALEQNDFDAQKILQETAEDLAFGLSHVVHLFHPEIIILGGGLSLVGEPLRSAVETTLQKFVMTAFLPAPKISLAKLGEDSVPVGALELAQAAWARDVSGEK
ncbi:MAG: ROK family protein [Verrucomicrobiota bacterium]|nr:ROK family protein [Verrucomicrobiota bacterium]